MRAEIEDALATPCNRYVQAWKARGKRVVGYPCTFVPEEVLSAAGLLPVRLRGVGADSTSIADAYYGPVICSFPKCILQLAGEGAYAFLDGALVVNGCDSLRRLHDCWRKADEDIAGTLPGYFYYYGVPHKVSPYAVDWLLKENRRFIASLEEHFGVRLTLESLKEAVRLYNKGRRLLMRLDAYRQAGLVSGTEATAITIAATAIPREEFNLLLEEILEEVPGRGEMPAGKRLLLAGSVSDDAELVRIIEEAGAWVVSDTLCFGSRAYVDLTSEEGDPLEALTLRYLTHSFCPRMFGYYRQRLDFLLQRALQARVDGVILQNIRFCDLHGSENGLFERDLEARGLPCLKLEREYGTLVEDGRIRMRVDAFLHRLR